MVETLEAVRATGLRTVVVYPCSDQGYEGIVRAIDELALPPQFRVHVNLEAPLFWGLLNVASVMVGNSSAGLIETPYFRLPAIDIGRRQDGRLHAENVLHVDHDRTAISAAIETALADGAFRGTVENCTRPFGDGRAGARIVDVLRDLTIDNALMVKRFVN
jgi:UDP-N-acetylglucosamine 2-epimerase